jgi:predicted ribosomally synthesized peptide with SipW-like signal peptide
MNYKDIIKKQSLLIVISIVVMSVILLGTSYALFNQTDSSTNNQVVTSGTLVVDYSASDSEALASDSIMPEEIDKGFKIRINNTGTLPMEYNILLYTTLDNQVPHSNIKVQLDDGEAKFLNTFTKTPETQNKTNINEIVYIIGTSSVDAQNQTDSDQKTHDIKVWLDTDDESIIGAKMR